MSSDLIELINARFTLVTFETPDVFLVGEVLQSILEEHGITLQSLKANDAKKSTAQVLWTYNLEPSNDTLSSLSINQKTLLIANYTGTNPAAFNIGKLPTPKAMIKKMLLSKFNPKNRDIIINALDGLSYLESKQLIRLAGLRSKDLTVPNIKELRNELYGAENGMSVVDTTGGFYVPDANVFKWFKETRPFLFSNDRVLAPRGVLLDGVGGTGKTEFAKFVSREMSVPLYHLDIGASLSRWQGESEENVRRHLKFVEDNAPCVLLIDEVEKALHTSNNEESSTRILAQLLWWLAEHKSKVLTVMTTNDKSVLPPELYRPGRIDEVFTLKPIEDLELQCKVIDSWVRSWGKNYALSDEIIYDIGQRTADAMSESPKTPAELINLAKVEARKFYIQNLAKG